MTESTGGIAIATVTMTAIGCGATIMTMIVDEHRRPPGWSHGRKTGWGDCDVLPGLAKKEGCHSFAHHSHRTITVRTPGTRPVVVRRPGGEVHAHAGVDAQVH